MAFVVFFDLHFLSAYVIIIDIGNRFPHKKKEQYEQK